MKLCFFSWGHARSVQGMAESSITVHMPWNNDDWSDIWKVKSKRYQSKMKQNSSEELLGYSFIWIWTTMGPEHPIHLYRSFSISPLEPLWNRSEVQHHLIGQRSLLPAVGITTIIKGCSPKCGGHSTDASSLAETSQITTSSASLTVLRAAIAARGTGRSPACRTVQPPSERWTQARS